MKTVSRVGFNIVWSVLAYTSIASIITPYYFKTSLYHDDPLSGRQRASNLR